MNEYIISQLTEVVKRIRTEQPHVYTESVRFYLNKVLKECSGCSEASFRAAIKVFWDDELYSKSLNYFIAIVKNKHDDAVKKKMKEKRSLGDLPETNK